MIDVARELAKHFDAAALGRERVRFDGAELPLVAPDSIEGFVEAVRFAAKEKLALVPIGFGSKLGWLRAPERADFLLSTRRFTGVVSHVPDDGTIALRAGTTMADARRIARDGGHWLTPDVSHPSTKTIGGVIAAGESGADRLRFGPTRHHVLGLKVVLADGTVTKCGGQLVKNVTGFDLMRLYTGSHGTLCVIVEAALRLFPEPEHEGWFTFPREQPRGPDDAVKRVLALPLRFVSLPMVARASGTSPAEPGHTGWTSYELHARLFGRREHVEADMAVLSSEFAGARASTDAEGRKLADEFRDVVAFDAPPRVSLHVTCSDLNWLSVLSAHIDLGVGLANCGVFTSMLMQPGLAQLEVDVSGMDPQPLSRFLTEMRPELADYGASIALRNAPSAVLATHEPLGEDIVGLDLMRAIKTQLDPQRVFARGRFANGL